MSPDAEQRMLRWSAWLGNDPSEQDVSEMTERWEQGMEPPAFPHRHGWWRDCQIHRNDLDVKTTITEGSVWFTIRPSMEADGYGAESCPPHPVKAWRREHDAPDAWRLSAFSEEDGRVDVDSNATSWHREQDVGRTLFADEAEAWAAWLGKAPTAESVAEELEDRAFGLEDKAHFSSVGKAAIAPHAEALRKIAVLIRKFA